MDNASYHSDWMANPLLSAEKQPHQIFPGRTSIRIGTEKHAASLQEPLSSGTFSTSKESLAPSLVSTATIPGTTRTSNTSLDTLSSARATVSNSIAAIPPTQPKRRSKYGSKRLPDEVLIPCVCCWETIQDLRKHYLSCQSLNGEWAFWPSPYYPNIVFSRQEPFTQHIKSFRPDKVRIETTSGKYVTPRKWLMDSREDAMKRQLENILYGYFRIHPEFADEWKLHNDGTITPNLNNVANIGNILDQCSRLLRSTRPSDQKESPIDQLKKLFPIDTEAVAEIPTGPVGSSRKRRRKISVPYTALDTIKSIDEVKVEVEDAGFNEEDFAQHQRLQLGAQDQRRYLSMGGVAQDSSVWPGISNTIPTGGFSNGPLSNENQTQLANGSWDNFSNGLADVRYGPQSYFSPDTGLPPPPQFPQMLQQRQNTHANPNANLTANDALSAFDFEFCSEYLPQGPPTLYQKSGVHEEPHPETSNVSNSLHSLHSDIRVPSLPTMQHGQFEHAYPNANNAFVNFASRNQDPLILQQTQKSNANTRYAHPAFDNVDQGSFQAHVNSAALGYGPQQYTNSGYYDYHAS